MSEPMEQTPLPGVSAASTPPPAPPLPPLPAVSDAAMQAQISTYVAQLEERNRQIQEAAFQRAQAQFERRIQELEQRNGIEAYARSRTMTSADQPFALPVPPEELTQLLLETPSTVRGKWQTLLTRITAGGLVSFDEIGSSGEASEAADRWQTLVNGKIAAGLSHVEAIRTVSREHPDVYNAQLRRKGGR